MARKYRVSLLEYYDKDDPTFDNFYDALKYTEDEGVKYSDSLYAIWEDDQPVVLLYMVDTFTWNGWSWPPQPKEKGFMIPKKADEQLALELL